MRFLRALLSLFLVFLIILLLFFKADIPSSKIEKEYADSESRFLEIDNLRVHYKDQGEGLPILLLHGTAAFLHTWDGWTETLKKHYRVLRMDLPAYGLTGPHPGRDYRIESYVHLIDRFTEALEIDTFILAGNSFGGNLSWVYAFQNQDRVQKLILIDPSGMPGNKEKPWIFRLAKMPVLNLILRYVTPKWFIVNNLRQVVHDDSKISDEMIKRYYDLSLRQGNRRAFIDRLNTDYPDRSSELKNISCPTLIIWGKEDIWIPSELGIEFHQRIENSELVILEGLGHIPMEEDPKATLTIVEPFLMNSSTK